MFVSTQIDRMQRNAKKLHGTRSNEKIIQKLKTPLYICIGLLLIIVLFCIYFAYHLHGSGSYLASNQISTSVDDVDEFKNTFIKKLQFAHQNPTQSKNHKLFIHENNLFVRTKTVQYLYDYAHAATKQMYADQYASDPNYHHIQCVETFTPALRDKMAEFEVAVRQFLNRKNGLFNQNLIKTLVKRDTITEENHGGLNKLVGQLGVIAIQNLDKNTCIGQYYGDEYLLDEFEEQFPWSTYGKMKQHPFKKKWDYYMTIPYATFADKRLELKGLNVTVAIDGYHSYDYGDYVKDGGQKLNAEQVKLKETYETFVNDARRQLYAAEMSKEDVMRKNCEFVYCAIDGVLYPFLVTTDDVKTNQQLFTYYGPNYG